MIGANMKQPYRVRIRQYEAEKKRLPVGLSAKEYEKRVKELADKYNI